MSDTEIQLYGVLSAWVANVTALLALQLALLGAYVLAAHRIGSLLSSQQVFIITSCLLFFSFVLTVQIYNSLQAMIDIRELAFFGYTTLRNATFFQWLVTLGCAISPIVCIRFMLHSRSPRRPNEKGQSQSNRRATR